MSRESISSLLRHRQYLEEQGRSRDGRREIQARQRMPQFDLEAAFA